LRPEAALAERRHAVRQAAAAWRRAGAIDDAALAAVLARYPDDRARLGPVFRSLAFVAGLLALNAFFGVLAIASSGARGFGIACLVFSLLLAGATELLTGPLRRADSGIETATALLAVVYAVVAFGVLAERTLNSERTLVAGVLAVAAALAALASARWGSPFLAVVAGVCGWLLLARLPSGRLLWLATAAALAPLLLRASESASLPPCHRRSFQAGLVLALCAFYLAAHLGSWDHRWLEWLTDFRADHGPGQPLLRTLSIVATAVGPALVVAFGVATRRAYLMDLGVLLGLASLVTLRFYVHLAPLWVVLTVSGTAALAATLWLRRYLATGPGGERFGFTAEPLFEDPARRRAAEVAGALVSFSPAPAAARDQARLQPGGGRYGGGGASGEF
jgi:hypothetical protein